jgi:AcrR family transcriptional regulator
MVMGKITEEVRRCRGRPQIRSDEATLRLVIEAAAVEFQANGYAGAGMEAVAQRAGISTKTLYRLVPTKADLFKSVVSDRAGRFILAIDEQVVGALDLVSALERILIAYGSLTLDQEVIAMTRLVLGESDRFPEIAETFYEEAIRPTSEAMADWLERQRRRGLISLDDPLVAVGMLRGMMVMEPQRAVMLGQRSIPDAGEIAMRAKICAVLFLKGCRLENP